jgi:hypothetical protein
LKLSLNPLKVPTEETPLRLLTEKEQFAMNKQSKNNDILEFIINDRYSISERFKEKEVFYF